MKIQQNLTDEKIFKIIFTLSLILHVFLSNSGGVPFFE